MGNGVAVVEVGVGVGVDDVDDEVGVVKDAEERRW